MQATKPTAYSDFELQPASAKFLRDGRKQNLTIAWRDKPDAAPEVIDCAWPHTVHVYDPDIVRMFGITATIRYKRDLDYPETPERYQIRVDAPLGDATDWLAINMARNFQPVIKIGEIFGPNRLFETDDFIVPSHDMPMALIIEHCDGPIHSIATLARTIEARPEWGSVWGPHAPSDKPAARDVWGHKPAAGPSFLGRFASLFDDSGKKQTRKYRDPPAGDPLAIGRIVPAPAPDLFVERNAQTMQLLADLANEPDPHTSGSRETLQAYINRARLITKPWRVDYDPVDDGIDGIMQRVCGYHLEDNSLILSRSEIPSVARALFGILTVTSSANSPAEIENKLSQPGASFQYRGHKVRFSQ